MKLDSLVVKGRVVVYLMEFGFVVQADTSLLSLLGGMFILWSPVVLLLNDEN